MRQCEMELPAGRLEVFYTAKGVTRISLPPRPRECSSVVRPEPHLGTGTAARLADELFRYFRGRPVAFSTPLDLGGVGSFDRRVYAVLRSIPCGEVRSYGWVAREMGMPGGARAVGGACGRNPCPVIIPCHRVVAAGGGLGGYSGGLAWKRYLIGLEKKLKKSFDTA